VVLRHSLVLIDDFFERVFENLIARVQVVGRLYLIRLLL
jgi:hypothetical protein